MIKRFCWKFSFVPGLITLWAMAAIFWVRPVMAEVSAAVITKAPAHALAVFDAYFYEGLNSYFDKKTTEAQEKWALLREEGRKKAYRNFPEFSAILIEQAKQAARHGEITDAKFLTAQALLLSPQRAQIYLSAFSLHDVLGLPMAISCLGTGLKLATTDMFVLVPLLRNALFVFMFSFSLSLVIFAIIHLCVQREVIMQRVGERMGRPYRVWLAPLLFFLFNTAPLLLGLFPALAVWSIFLAHHVYHCRRLSVYVALTIIVWGTLLPLLAQIDRQAKDPFAKALGNLSTYSYSSEDQNILADRLAANSDDLWALILLGQRALIEGNLAEADQYLSRYLKLPQPQGYYTAAHINLGLVYLLQNQPDLASAQFIKAELKDNSVQFYYLYSQLLLKQLNTKQSSEYYQKALKRDREWLTMHEPDLQDNLVVAHITVPKSAQLSFYLKASSTPDTGSAPRENAVVKQMIKFSTPWSLSILGLLSLFFTFLSSRVSFRRRDRQEQKLRARRALRETISAVWLFLPGGYHLRSSYPLVGTINFSLLVSLLVWQYNEPIGFLPVTLLEAQIPYVTPVIIGLFYTLGFVGYGVNKIRQQVG